MHVNLSHFEVSFLFALFTAIVFGVVGRDGNRQRIRYGAGVFGYFLLATFGVGWLMYFGHL